MPAGLARRTPSRCRTSVHCARTYCYGPLVLGVGRCCCCLGQHQPDSVGCFCARGVRRRCGTAPRCGTRNTRGRRRHPPCAPAPAHRKPSRCGRSGCSPGTARMYRNSCSRTPPGTARCRTAGRLTRARCEQLPPPEIRMRTATTAEVARFVPWVPAPRVPSVAGRAPAASESCVPVPVWRVMVLKDSVRHRTTGVRYPIGLGRVPAGGARG